MSCRVGCRASFRPNTLPGRSGPCRRRRPCRRRSPRSRARSSFAGAVRVDQLVRHLHGEGVQLLGPVQRQGQDMVGHFSSSPEEVFNEFRSIKPHAIRYAIAASNIKRFSSAMLNGIMRTIALIVHPAKNMDEIPIDQALQELHSTLEDLLRQCRTPPPAANHSGISCRHYWNPTARTFTYHTHVVVPDILSTKIEMLSHLFFNAYTLQQHGWYSQFVSGTMTSLPITTAVAGQHQLGQGYFDFGVGALRRYHLLFSKIDVDPLTRAVVLRSVPAQMPVLKPSRQVFILPPTGDIF